MERVDTEGQVVTAKVLLCVWEQSSALLHNSVLESGYHAVPNPSGYKRTCSDHHL